MLNIFDNSINGHLLNCPITSLDCLSENISVESQPVECLMPWSSLSFFRACLKLKLKMQLQGLIEQISIDFDLNFSLILF